MTPGSRGGSPSRENNRNPDGGRSGGGDDDNNDDDEERAAAERRGRGPAGGGGDLGDGEGDEERDKTTIWGTTVNVQTCYNAFQYFMSEFTLAFEFEPYYSRQLHTLHRTNR